MNQLHLSCRTRESEKSFDDVSIAVDAEILFRGSESGVAKWLRGLLESKNSSESQKRISTLEGAVELLREAYSVCFQQKEAVTSEVDTLRVMVKALIKATEYCPTHRNCDEVSRATYFVHNGQYRREK